jgi:coenzyme F420-0:L-glutamate ligase / coenzyme F420-1:gamma-L-glutamate ligase
VRVAVSLHPLTGIPLVEAGDDLVALIVDALGRSSLTLEDGDVVAVTGKIVSKAEGRLVSLSSLTPSAQAERLAALTDKDPRLVELVLQESSEVVRARLNVLLVRHVRGWVSAMAGIDRSNVDGDDEHALLLPADPDASAASLRDGLQAATGAAVGVLITDSHGRPFRVGNVGVALGAAGVESVRWLEGSPDLFGRPLTTATVVPLADLVASASLLLTGEGNEGIPVVVVRGLSMAGDVGAPALVRDPAADLFAVPDRDYA